MYKIFLISCVLSLALSEKIVKDFTIDQLAWIKKARNDVFSPVFSRLDSSRQQVVIQVFNESLHENDNFQDVQRAVYEKLVDRLEIEFNVIIGLKGHFANTVVTETNNYLWGYVGDLEIDIFADSL